MASRLFRCCLVATAIAAVDARQQNADQWAAFSQEGWDVVHGPDPELGEPVFVVVLALKQRNLEFLEKRARRVSSPDDVAYGQYYKRDELNDLVRPDRENIEIVRRFLEATPGSVQFSTADDLVLFRCSLRCVEETFRTKLSKHMRRVNPGESPWRAATPIQLPSEVAAVLDGVSLNAPVIMPERPEQPKVSDFAYPASGRSAPRINPLLFNSGDGLVNVRWAAYCKDGQAQRHEIQHGICAQHGEAKSITMFEIVVVQGRSHSVINVPITANVMGERPADCGGGPGSCMEFNTTIRSLQNFESTRARIRAHFGDGSVSLFSDLDELVETWPFPYTTPHSLAEYYGIPLQMPIRHPRNIISVVEFQGQFYNPHDLEKMFRLMGVRYFHQGVKLVGTNLPHAGSVFGGEAQLDIQYIMAMATNVTTWFWSVPGMNLETAQEPFLYWLMQVLDSDDDNMPLVHSVSYGDREDDMPEWFVRRANVELMKVALRGVSVLCSTGDDGSSGGKVMTDPSKCNQAMPQFPSSSPWVTAVGGTQFAKADSPVCNYESDQVFVNCHGTGEVMCSADKGGVVTAGGGFSYFFEQPWYQKDEVDHYLTLQGDTPIPDPEAWRYNPAGRAYPDISAVANNYLVWMGDHLRPTSGTSASTPLVASMVARLNEERLQRDLPPLGFLNPMLYKMAREHPEAFNDVVMGSTRCARKNMCCETGFGAARGWDAATGIGSPNLGKMLELIRPRHNEGWAMAPFSLIQAASAGGGAPLASAAGVLLAVAAFVAGAACLAAGSVVRSARRRGRAFRSASSSLQTPLCGGIDPLAV